MKSSSIWNTKSQTGQCFWYFKHFCSFNLWSQGFLFKNWESNSIFYSSVKFYSNCPRAFSLCKKVASITLIFPQIHSFCVVVIIDVLWHFHFFFWNLSTVIDCTLLKTVVWFMKKTFLYFSLLYKPLETMPSCHHPIRKLCHQGPSLLGFHLSFFSPTLPV